MIEGLRLLPWVHWYREKRKDERDPNATNYLDCEWCMSVTSRQQRANIQCGWLPESEHGKGHTPALGDAPCPETSVCPGYTIRLPEVLECARMVGWADAGVLRDAVDGQITQAAIDGMDVVRSEIRSVERHALRVVSEGVKHGPR